MPFPVYAQVLINLVSVSNQIKRAIPDAKCVKTALQTIAASVPPLVPINQFEIPIQRKIINKIERSKRPQSLRDLGAALQISPKSVRHILKENGFKFARLRKKLFLSEKLAKIESDLLKK